MMIIPAKPYSESLRDLIQSVENLNDRYKVGKPLKSNDLLAVLGICDFVRQALDLHPELADEVFGTWAMWNAQEDAEDQRRKASERP